MCLSKHTFPVFYYFYNFKLHFLHFIKKTNQVVVCGSDWSGGQSSRQVGKGNLPRVRGEEVEEKNL